MSEEDAVRQLAALNAMTRSDTIRTDDLGTALRRIAQIAARTLGVERVSVWRYNKDRSAIGRLLLYELGEDRHSSGEELAVSEYPAYFEALARNEIIAANDALHDLRTRELLTDYLMPLGITSMMDVPIYSAGSLEGVLCHEHVGPPRQWTTDEQLFAVATANLVTLALDRAGEHRSIETTLRHYQRERQIILDSVPALIWYKDAHNRISLVNRPAANSLGLSVEEIQGRTTDELYPVHAAQYYQDDLEVIQTGRPKIGIIEPYLLPSGEKRWIRTDKVPYRDEHGDIKGVIVFAVDITDQRRAEEALQQSEEQFRTLAETMPQIVWTAAPDGSVTYLNHHWSDYTGLTLEQTRGRGWSAVLHPEDLQLCIDRWAEACQTGRSYEIEYRFKRASDGTYRWHLGRATPLRDAAGRIIKWVGTSTDIDDQKRTVEVLRRAHEELGVRVQERTAELRAEVMERSRAEDALRVSEERFRSAFENAAIGMAIVALDGRWLQVNRSLCEIVGYTEEELLTKTFQAITHPDDLDHALGYVRRMLGGEIPYYQTEKRYIHKNGHIVWVLLNASLVRDRSNSPLYFIGQIENITQHKVAEQRLKTLNECFVNLGVEAGENINRLTRVCGELLNATSALYSRLDGRMLVARGQWQVPSSFIRGDKPEGRPCYDVIQRAEEQPLVVRDLLHSTYAQADSNVLLFNLQTYVGQAVKCGGVVVGSLSVMYQKDVELDKEDKKLLGILAAAIGVEEERKRIADELRQTQKMEAVGKLAGGIAHDFNNLLTVILGHSGLLLSIPDQHHPIRPELEAIRTAAERAATLTRQLLAFSRKQVLQPRELNLNTVITEMHSMLRPLMGERINLIPVLDFSLGRIKADRGQLEQVIMNLAINARDAMSQGGTLVIRTENVDESPSTHGRHLDLPPGGYVKLIVSDTGCGMDADTRLHIFEPFFTTKERGKGTGLGLSTVYGIVRQSGGTIDVRSLPGQGTTFTIYLPRIESTEPADAEGVPVPSTGGAGTVLLVEDEDMVRRLAQKVLARLGYHVVTASTGEEALRVHQEHTEPIQLLVTDLVMPGMNGVELARRVVARRSDTKVLLMSGYPDDVTGQHDLQSIGFPFLQKPFTAESLGRKVDELIRVV